MNRSLSGLIVALIAAFVVGIGVASAHAEYVSSLPAAGASVATAPTTVKVTFSEELNAQGNELKVTTGGAVVDMGNTALDKSDADRKTVIVSLKTGLKDGVYTVNWKNSSADGHSEEGSFTFTVGTATAPATSAPAPSNLPQTGAGERLPWFVVAIAAVFLGVGMIARRFATRSTR